MTAAPVLRLREHLASQQTACLALLAELAAIESHATQREGVEAVGPLGVPCLDGMGPAGGGLVTDQERVVVATLPERAALLAGMLHALGTGAWAGCARRRPAAPRVDGRTRGRDGRLPRAHRRHGPVGGAVMTAGEYIELPTLAERATLVAALAHKLATRPGAVPRTG
jgi:hypothetical protein